MNSVVMNSIAKYAILIFMGGFSIIGNAAGSSGHHDFPPAVAAFHDVLSPLWHSEMGEQRSQRICQQAPALSSAADDIMRADTPASVNGEQWGIAAEKLRQSVVVISKNCAEEISVESAMVDVHDKFHGLVKLVGHEHSTSAPLVHDSKDEAADYLIVSEAFSECAALQNTLADLASNSEEEYENHALHKAGKDALIIATDFAVAGGREESLAEFQYEHHISRFKIILEKNKSGYEDFATEVQPIISKCAALNRIQSGLISERRKQNHSVK